MLLYVYRNHTAYQGRGVYMSSHVIEIDIDVYSAFAVTFNILCLEVAYDSKRLFHSYLHYIYDLILYLCIKYYTVCYLTGIFYAVVRQISMLFIDNNCFVFCILSPGQPPRLSHSS